MSFTVEPWDIFAASVGRLFSELDADLLQRYPGSSTNGVDPAAFAAEGGYVALARTLSGEWVGCGALRPGSAESGEIKRMFVRPVFRRRGASRLILQHLEEVARSRGLRGLVLETGRKQPEAMALYQAAGYFPIPRYEPHTNDPDSVCFAKSL